MTNTTSKPFSSPLTVLNAVPWQMAIMSIVVFVLILAYMLIMVATYRVSHRLHPFILFFSEGVANLWIAVFALPGFFEQMFPEPKRLLGDSLGVYVLATFCTYVSIAHLLVIALNRATAIFFPLKYDSWWPRERIIGSVALVWVVGTGFELVNIYHYFTLHAIPKFFTIYVVIQSTVTVSSLCLYSAALGWILLGRLFQLLKPYRASHSPNNNISNSTLRVISTDKIDLRIFIYCFLSFLPYCYNMVVRPAPGLHFIIYATFRVISPGMLLYAMSSAIREQMPGKNLLQRCRKLAMRLCPHWSKTTVIPITLQLQTLSVEAPPSNTAQVLDKPRNYNE